MNVFVRAVAASELLVMPIVVMASIYRSWAEVTLGSNGVLPPPWCLRWLLYGGVSTLMALSCGAIATRLRRRVPDLVRSAAVVESWALVAVLLYFSLLAGFGLTQRPEHPFRAFMVVNGILVSVGAATFALTAGLFINGPRRPRLSAGLSVTVPLLPLALAAAEATVGS
jgi:hypothetical protein